MGDFSLPPANTLIVGMTGSGKTTFAIRYLLNVQATCRFVFDDLGRFATRLKTRPCYTALDLETALGTRWVIFNPHRMFQGETEKAFRFFCQWVYDASCRGPGKKLCVVDELWQWCSPHAIPKELALVCQTGREENLELVNCTQLPHRVNASIIGQSTELVCFRLDERLALDCVAGYGIDRQTASNLPLGHYVARNRLSGGMLKGRMW